MITELVRLTGLYSHEFTNIRPSRGTGLRTQQIYSFPEEVHARNKSNFYWSLTIRQRR